MPGIVEISNSATSAVARESGFAAVGIEDTAVEISVSRLRLRDYCDAVAACAVMPVAAPARELAEVGNAGYLICFDYEVVVSESVEFREFRGHLSIQVCCLTPQVCR